MFPLVGVFSCFESIQHFKFEKSGQLWSIANAIAECQQKCKCYRLCIFYSPILIKKNLRVTKIKVIDVLTAFKRFEIFKENISPVDYFQKP